MQNKSAEYGFDDNLRPQTVRFSRVRLLRFKDGKITFRPSTPPPGVYLVYYGTRTVFPNGECLFQIALMGPADVRYGRYRRARHVAVNAGERTELLYAIRQTVEDRASLARSARSARQCVLSGEKTLSRHPVYGQSACLLECDVRERRVHGEGRSLSTVHRWSGA